MGRVPALRTRLGPRHVLARGGRRVGLLGLPPRLRVGDGLSRLHLDGEPGPGGRGGRGVGGRDGLRVGLGVRGGGGVVVRLVGGGVLRGLVLAGVAGGRVVLALGVRRVAHRWPTLRRPRALVRWPVVIPREVLVVRHVVVQLRGVGRRTQGRFWGERSREHEASVRVSRGGVSYLCAGVLRAAVQVGQHAGEGVDIRVDIGVIARWLFGTTVLTT